MSSAQEESIVRWSTGHAAATGEFPCEQHATIHADTGLVSEQTHHAGMYIYIYIHVNLYTSLQHLYIHMYAVGIILHLSKL